jgi:hypothetical protein
METDVEPQRHHPIPTTNMPSRSEHAGPPITALQKVVPTAVIAINARRLPVYRLLYVPDIRRAVRDNGASGGVSSLNFGPLATAAFSFAGASHSSSTTSMARASFCIFSLSARSLAISASSTAIHSGSRAGSGGCLLAYWLMPHHVHTYGRGHQLR